MYFASYWNVLHLLAYSYRILDSSSSSADSVWKKDGVEDRRLHLLQEEEWHDYKQTLFVILADSLIIWKLLWQAY